VGPPAVSPAIGENDLVTGRAPVSAAPAVRVEHLTVVRGRTRAVDDVSFELNAGTLVGLLGPSGCGKTTLMRSLVGTQVVSSGTVTLLGEPAGSPRLRDRVGYVTQVPSVYGDLTVRENLSYFATILGSSSEAVERVLTDVDLDNHADSMMDSPLRPLAETIPFPRLVGHACPT
jgi:ABC-2 type transport system ATP-binding protein